MESETASPEARRIEATFRPYFEARERLRLDPEGRAAKHTHWEETTPEEWRVVQTLADPGDTNDWAAEFVVALGESRAQQRAVLRFEGLQTL